MFSREGKKLNPKEPEWRKQIEFDKASALVDAFLQGIMEIPMTTTQWIDKHEPATLEDMVLNTKTRAKLVNVMRDCPHVILFGAPGMGKTTFCNVFFKKTNHIYISGKSGVAVIREKVKQFAMVGNLDTFFSSDSPQPSIKYVIINEADWLSDDSQAELRTIVEEFQKITRFAFITNEVDKLQEQIRSRCVEVEFEKAQPKDVVEFVRRILVAEGVSDEHLGNRVNLAWQHYPGDIRRVVNWIQSLVVDGKLDPG